MPNLDRLKLDRLKLDRLKRRADFLRVAATRRKFVTPGLILQIAPIPETSASDGASDGASYGASRLGFTVSKKVGNAVRRNRARRRLKAVAQDVMVENAIAGRDFVIIGRAATVRRPYDLLLQDLRRALKHLDAFQGVEENGT